MDLLMDKVEGWRREGGADLQSMLSNVLPLEGSRGTQPLHA